MKTLLVTAFYSICITLSVTACGPASTLQAPGLPGSGTEFLGDINNNTNPQITERGKDSKIDPWKDKELISPPSAQKPTKLNLPSISYFTLKNGLQVIAVQDKASSVTSIQVAIKSGGIDASAPKKGIAEFAAQTLIRGSKSRDASVIANEIEAVGGILQASTSLEATFFSCKTLTKDKGTCLTVLSDVLANPQFQQSEIAYIRQAMRANMRGRLDNAGLLASAHFSNALWGNMHPKGWVTSERTIDAISKQDLVLWHKNHILPNNAILAISGNIDTSKLQKQLERYFARWRKGTPALKKSFTHKKLKGMSILLVDKPGQTQSHIRIGHFGLSHTDPDFYGAQIFNYVLGGGQFSSRLMKTIRSAEGKAYTANSRLDRSNTIGAFVAGTFTRSAETVSTIKLLINEITAMAKEGPTVKEHQEAIANISGSYKTRFEGVADIASAVLAAKLHGLNDSYVQNFPLQIANITVEITSKIANKVLDPTNLVLVIVGDAKVVAPQLKMAGWKFEMASVSEPISREERLKRRQTAISKTDAKTLVEAKRLLDQALAKKGGAAKLKKLGSFHWKGEAVLTLPSGPMTATVEKRYSKPDHFRLDMVMANGQVQISTVMTGSTGWAKEINPQTNKIRQFSPTELKALQIQLWRDPELVLLRHLEKDTVIVSMSEFVLRGTPVKRIQLSNSTGNQVMLWIEPKSKLLWGMAYADQGIKTNEQYGAYKNVKGLQVAHHRTTKGAQVDLQVNIKSFVHGTKLPSSDFKQPKPQK